MKRTLALVLALLLLTGCSLTADTYQSERKHEEKTNQAPLPAAVEVSDFEEMKAAILQFISGGRETGSIRTKNYSGNVEEDTAKAVYDATRKDPVGAFAVDYLNYNCVKIVNYYEITVDITYRNAIYEVDTIQKIRGEADIELQVQKALQNFKGRLAMRIKENQSYDINAIMQAFFAENPEKLVEIPQINVMVYPDSGPERVVEVEFAYTHTPTELRQMQKAMEESVAAAAEYIRYRDSDRSKVQLLHTYLTERFGYEQKDTPTPVYSALCEGIADSVGLAHGFAMICRRAGVECYYVTGFLGGESRVWNIVADDGDFRHVDLAECIGEGKTLSLKTDWEMGDYYWNTQEYPPCIVVETPVVPEEPAEEVPQEETQTEAETQEPTEEEAA